MLLAGGCDKKLPWDEFAAETVRRVYHLVTFGEAGPMIARVVEERLSAAPPLSIPLGGMKGGRLEGVTQVETLEEAVEVAARLTRPGEVVLLSPGATSFDAFRDFAERGDRFKELVWGL